MKPLDMLKQINESHMDPDLCNALKEQCKVELTLAELESLINQGDYTHPTNQLPLSERGNLSVPDFFGEYFSGGVHNTGSTTIIYSETDSLVVGTLDCLQLWVNQQKKNHITPNVVFALGRNSPNKVLRDTCTLNPQGYEVRVTQDDSLLDFKHLPRGSFLVCYIDDNVRTGIDFTYARNVLAKKGIHIVVISVQIPSNAMIGEFDMVLEVLKGDVPQELCIDRKKCRIAPNNPERHLYLKSNGTLT